MFKNYYSIEKQSLIRRIDFASFSKNEKEVIMLLKYISNIRLDEQLIIYSFGENNFNLIKALCKKGYIEKEGGFYYCSKIAKVKFSEEDYKEDELIEKAKIVCEKALEYIINIKGENNIEVAMAYLDLAFISKKLKDEKQGLLYSEKVYDIIKNNKEISPTRLSFTYKILGTFYRSIEKYTEAINCLNKAQEIIEENKVSHHELKAYVFVQLGYTFLKMGGEEYAKNYYKSALAFMEDLFGEKDIRLDVPLKKLSMIERQRGNYSKAIALNDRILKIRIEAYGENSEEVIKVYEDYALNFRELNAFTNVIICYINILEILKSIFDTDENERFIKVNTLLGKAYFYNREFDKAIETYRYSLQLATKVLDNTDDEFAKIYLNLGVVLNERELVKEAFEYLDKAIEITKENYGEDSLETVLMYDDVANVSFSNFDFKEALTYYTKVLEILNKDDFKDKLNIALLYYRASLIYGELLDFEKSEIYCKKAIDLYINYYKTKEIDITFAYDWLSSIYYKKGDDDNFVKTIDRELEIINRTHGENASKTVGLVYNKALGLSNADRHKEAVIHFEEVAKIARKDGKFDLLFLALENLGNICFKVSKVLLEKNDNIKGKVELKKAFIYYKKSFKVIIITF